MNYPLPANETERLFALNELQLMDTVTESAFDDLTTLAAEVCGTPIALIALIDGKRQWFKSRVGIEITETPRSLAFCNYTICQEELLVVPDTLEDERFAEHPLVTTGPHIRFYAGAPLLTRGGHALGTLCVADSQPRTLTAQQKRTLRVLSQHVSAQLELRRIGLIRRKEEAALAQANAELEQLVQQRTQQLQATVRQAEQARMDVYRMVERMSDGMVAFDALGRFDYVNPKASEMLGLKPVEMIGRTLADVYSGAAPHPIVETYEKAVRAQQPRELEFQQGGCGPWLEVRCYPSREGVSAFFQDITARKEAELRFQREQALSETIVKSLPGNFYLFDEHGAYLRWNKMAELATGLADEEFKKTHPSQMIAPEDRQTVINAIQRAFETGEDAVEARIHNRATGENRWHLMTGRLIEVEQRRCLLGIGIDISARKAVEQALEEARSRLEVAVRASGIGFWTWEIAENRVYLSPELKKDMGVPAGEASVSPEFIESCVHPEDRDRVVASLHERLRKPAGEFEQEYRILRANGQHRWVLSRSRLFADTAGLPERLLGCHIDITDRRATEEALRSSREQLRALAEHLHTIREEEARRIARELHDEIGAALTALKLDLGWVDRHLAKHVERALAQPARDRLARINGDVDAGMASMRKICQMLRPAVLDQLGLASAIEWQCSEFQGRTGVRCAVTRDEVLDLDQAKSTAIFRILQELLTNVTRHANARRVEVSACCADGEFCLSVADDGCGLPADALVRQRSFGLVGVRERAVAAGGHATFEPTKGGGTTARVCIPLTPEKETGWTPGL